ncbi:MAG: glycosyltransferase family 4 protein [Thiobacillaceae bacterium]
MNPLTPQSLTVLQMLPALQSGGVERGTLEIADALKRAGHVALVMSQGGAMVDELEALGAEHFTWAIGKKSPFALRLIRPLRRFLINHQVDILHVRSRFPAWIAYLAWRGMDPTTRPHLVTTVHGMYSVNAYSRVMTQGETVIAVSNTVHDYILTHYPDTPADRIEVIHRGVSAQAYPYGYHPDENWKRSFFEHYPDALGKQILTLPGRITRLKGHEAFLDLVAELVAEGRPVHGLIVGGTSASKQAYLRQLKTKMHALGLEHHVSFTGQRADLKNILAVSNLVLSLSSHPESFGRTTLEALRLGIPVAGYDHGGVGEILHAMYPEGSLPKGDKNATLIAVRRLLDNPGSVTTAEFFPLRQMLDKTLAVYNKLARASSRSPGSH